MIKYNQRKTRVTNLINIYMFFIFLFFIQNSQPEQIIIHYPQFCAQYRFTFNKVAN